jgi:hypothetical protein
MFQRYAQSIDPDDERFTGFITQYLRDRDVKDAKALRYAELYSLIKEGIRAYLRDRESLPSARK